MASTPPSPPLVWVTQGKEQHAAHLLETRRDECLIRWNSTNKIAMVHQQDVAHALTPRRRKRPVIEEPSTSDGDSEEENMIIEQNQAPLNGNGKLKTPPRGIQKDEQDTVMNSDDTEVQVLLNIQPPTPKRPKQKGLNESQTDYCVNEARRVSTSPQPNNKVSEEQPLEEQEDLVRFAAPDVGALAQSVDSINDSDQAPTTEPTFTLQSSAYVQSLAEICYTILNDARWRVQGAAQKRLFAWEHGEDLSAVCILSKLFDPPKRSCISKCSCLLCREKESSHQGCCVDEEKVSVEDASTKGDGIVSLRQSLGPEVDEETVRALYLYCRIYYRKGPWFRLDTIYKSYYAPKKRTASPTNGELSTGSLTVEEKDSDAALKGRRYSFFERSSSFQFKTIGEDSRPAKKDEVIDKTELEQHIFAVGLMLRDVDRLHESGLIRSFYNEEECGKTVGAVTPEGHGVVLLAEERKTIVAKLGGRIKKDKNGRTAESAIAAASSTSGRRSPLVARENVIWKQMCQQKSISTLLSKENGTRVLPVCRHVNDVVLEKLATYMVLASSAVDYAPASILKSAVSGVKARILGLWKPSSRSLSLCFKLREAPLLTLRRCARIYLCATSGPGDMRGDGTNAWRSLHEIDTASIHPDVPLPTVIQPPGSHSWHHVQYPALSYRFGITCCAFIDAHEFIECERVDSYTEKVAAVPRELSKQANDHQWMSRTLQTQVFETVEAFQMWELCVEVRAHVDYHLELNDLLAYNSRRRARENDSAENRKPEISNVCDIVVHPEDVKDSEEGPCLSFTSECDIALDFAEILSFRGRKSIISKLVVLSGTTDTRSGDVNEILARVETTILELETFAASEKKRTAKVDAGGGELSHSERIVIVFSVIILHLLVTRNHTITAKELASKQARPWLRHLYWEGILAYAMWDCVPVLERKGFYDLACSCLEVLLFGKIQNRGNSVTSKTPDASQHFEKEALAELLMSRRTRGKAHERLMIDYVHLLRWQAKVDSRSLGEGPDPPAEKRKKDESGESSPQEAVRRVCSRVVGAVARAGSIPFSAVRSLARRMKAPLTESLEAVPCAEVNALGIRLDNGIDTTITEGKEKKEQTKGYIDWIPPTDQAVANAMAGEETVVGKRCSYVGFEENASGKADTSSFNVEELAMQYYASGRLPVSSTAGDALSGGGWVGWHDEGGHARALFRIVCAHPILGMESGCGKHSSSPLESLERLTIHLTPYQAAPFDLHVAHSESISSEDRTSESKGAGAVVRSFYHRRRVQIDAFLTKLEGLSAQELSDLVYDSVVCRLGQGRLQDKLVHRDLQQVRTLSMLAAGFGGQMLSAMFRCFLFDYRHYSGGLPDLLLVRALTTCNTEAGEQKSLIDLGEFVAEEFSAESKMEEESASRSRLLIDKDDEFLGCSKVGDSGGQTSSRRRRGTQRMTSRSDETEESNQFCLDNLPPRLVLRHNDQDVHVQCLFVEVKSQNDRLDGRQEDWLNVLDRVGKARVCKFGSGKKKAGKGASIKAED